MSRERLSGIQDGCHTALKSFRDAIKVKTTGHGEPQVPELAQSPNSP